MVRGAGPTTEVVVVHRPRYDDWTLPKGKDDPGESGRQAALREVWEETGLRCRIVGEAGTTRYAVSAGPKEVRYFAMRAYRAAPFVPNDEVDEVRWMGVKKARKQLSYDYDRKLLGDLDFGAATVHSDLHLVRHTAAGDRSRWKGPDEERPLTKKGEAQARTLAEELAGIGVTRVLSSRYLRCVQTVDPLARHLDVKVEDHEGLAEGAGRKAIASVLAEVAGTTTVLCSHGDVIPAMLEQLARQGTKFLSPLACQKGSTWSIAHDGKNFIEARYLPPSEP